MTYCQKYTFVIGGKTILQFFKNLSNIYKTYVKMAFLYFIYMSMSVFLKISLEGCIFENLRVYSICDAVASRASSKFSEAPQVEICVRNSEAKNVAYSDIGYHISFSVLCILHEKRSCFFFNMKTGGVSCVRGVSCIQIGPRTVTVLFDSAYSKFHMQQPRFAYEYITSSNKGPLPVYITLLDIAF